MKIKTTFIKMTLVLVMIATFSLNVFAGIDYMGGVWSYGGHHDPSNWGAFSNFYHGTKWHSSTVTSYKNSNSDYDRKGPTKTSKAFINTEIGESVKFEADAEDR